MKSNELPLLDKISSRVLWVFWSTEDKLHHDASPLIKTFNYLTNGQVKKVINLLDPNHHSADSPFLFQTKNFNCDLRIYHIQEKSNFEEHLQQGIILLEQRIKTSHKEQDSIYLIGKKLESRQQSIQKIFKDHHLFYFKATI